jgi:hypothetical protein
MFSGHIDLRTHTKILSALRADTPTRVRVIVFGAEDTSTKASTSTLSAARRGTGFDGGVLL